MSDSVQVYNEVLCRELFEIPGSPPNSPPRKNSREGQGELLEQADCQTEHNAMETEHNAMDPVCWFNTKLPVNVFLDNEEELKIKNICKKLSDRNQQLEHELEDTIKSRDILSEYKREILFKNWNERVFVPLQNIICKALNEETLLSLQTKKRHLFAEYLNLFKNDHIFLNIHPSGHPNAKVYIPNDPMLQKNYSSDCKKRDNRCDAVYWIAMHIKQIDSDARRRSRCCYIKEVPKETIVET